MPWTRKQVKKLLAPNSPLTPAQMVKMKNELHLNPALGPAKKGRSALRPPLAPNRNALRARVTNWK